MTSTLSAQVPDGNRNALISFYNATTGENWKDNTHWLGAPGTECEWYGVSCSGNPKRITLLELPSNGLSGELSEPLTELGELGTLDLSGNDLTSELPAWLGDMELRRLDLSHNQLEGTIDPAVAAMELDFPVQLDLSENRFGGPLPEALMALNPVPANGTIDDAIVDVFQMRRRPGFNLCGNALESADDELIEFVETHHFGAGFKHCQGPGMPVDPTLSGSRFNPQRSGEGLVQHVLDNGNVLLFWFTHEREEQAWFLRVAEDPVRSVRFEGLNRTEGHFGEGGTANLLTHFLLRIDRDFEGVQHMAYSGVVSTELALGQLRSNIMSQNYEQIDLTRLAGSTCDSQQPHQWISGAWYDPARSGEGFMVEVNEDGRVVVYWFTYVPDDSGEQAWMIGTGQFADGQVVIDEMIQPVGTRFGKDFDSAEIEYIDWGSLTLEFNSDSSGHITYESHLPEFGSGSYSIERLARPTLADCGSDNSQN